MAPYFLTVHLPQGFSQKDEERSFLLRGRYENRPQAFWVTDLSPVGEAMLRLHRKPYRQHGCPPIFELYDAAALDPERCGAFQQDVDLIKGRLESSPDGPEAASAGEYRICFLAKANCQARNLEPMVRGQLRRRNATSGDAGALRSIAGTLRRWTAAIETGDVDNARRALRWRKRPLDAFWQKEVIDPLEQLLKPPEPSPAELQRTQQAETILDRHKGASREAFEAVSGKLKLLCSCADSFGCFASAQKGLDFLKSAISSDNPAAVFESVSLPPEVLNEYARWPARWRNRRGVSFLADEIDRWAEELEKRHQQEPATGNDLGPLEAHGDDVVGGKAPTARSAAQGLSHAMEDALAACQMMLDYLANVEGTILSQGVPALRDALTRDLDEDERAEFCQFAGEQEIPLVMPPGVTAETVGGFFDKVFCIAEKHLGDHQPLKAALDFHAAWESGSRTLATVKEFRKAKVRAAEFLRRLSIRIRAGVTVSGAEMAGGNGVAPTATTGHSDEMSRSRESASPVEATGQQAGHDGKPGLQLAARLEECLAHRVTLEGRRTKEGIIVHLNELNVSYILCAARPLVLSLEFEGRGILAARLERLVGDVRAEARQLDEVISEGQGTAEERYQEADLARQSVEGAARQLIEWLRALEAQSVSQASGQAGPNGEGGKGRGIYLWWTWGTVYPQDPTTDLDERFYFYKVASEEVANQLCRAFNSVHGDEIRFGHALGEALDIDERARADDSVAEYRRGEVKGEDAQLLFATAREWEIHPPTDLLVVGEGKGSADDSLPSSSPAAANRQPAAAAGKNLDQALDALLAVVDKHRLTFIFFALPKRLMGRNRGWETMYRDELPHCRIPAEEIDNDGQFLLRYRWQLDCFAGSAISRFGPGDGTKPSDLQADGRWIDTEGGSFPYWSLDEMDCQFMERSSDVVLAACSVVSACDPSGRVRPLLNRVVGISHDNDQPRWYSSVLVRWRYLSDLDEIILAIKKARAGIPDLHVAPTSPDTDGRSTEAAQATSASGVSSFYLVVKTEKGGFNFEMPH